MKPINHTPQPEINSAPKNNSSPSLEQLLHFIINKRAEIITDLPEVNKPAINSFDGTARDLRMVKLLTWYSQYETYFNKSMNPDCTLPEAIQSFKLFCCRKIKEHNDRSAKTTTE